jgi:putative transposase
MGLMGIEAIYPKPRLSKANELHPKYPYLLKGFIVNRPNQVWSTDITYIPTLKGFVYLVAIMDWYSRYVLSWDVSNSLESSFCIKVLERSIARYGKPEIFNSDQGSQFTDGKFTGILNQANVRISMDGRGRCWDNIFIERLWRSVKYEEVYLKEYPTLPDARSSIEKYFRFYNESRPHQSLDYRTPNEVHFSTGNR